MAALLDIPKTSPPKVIAGTTTDFRRVILARNGLDARETKERMALILGARLGRRREMQVLGSRERWKGVPR